MSKVRINDLARELEVKSRAILDVLTDCGVTEKKTHSSSLEGDEAERVRAHFARGGRSAAQSTAKRAEEAKPKIDWSRVSKPGDVLKAIQERKEQSTAAPVPTPHVPPTVAATAPTSSPAAPRPAVAAVPPVVVAAVPPAVVASVSARPTADALAATPAVAAKPAPRRIVPQPRQAPRIITRPTEQPAIASRPPVAVVAAPPPAVVAPAQEKKPSVETARPAHSTVVSAPKPASAAHAPSAVAAPPVAPAAAAPVEAVPAAMEASVASVAPTTPAVPEKPAAPARRVIMPQTGPRPVYTAPPPPPTPVRPPSQNAGGIQRGKPIFDRRPGGPSPGGPGQRPSGPGGRRPMHPTRSQPGGGPSGPGGRPGFGGPGGRPGFGGPRPGGFGQRPGQGMGAPGLMPPPGDAPGRPARPGAQQKRGRNNNQYQKSKEGPMKGFAPPSRFGGAQIPSEPLPITRTITVTEGISVKDLAEKLEVRGKDLIATLLMRGVFVTVNQSLDAELVKDVARQFGAETDVITFEDQMANEALENMLEQENPDEMEVVRPPVVTVMGHVDHGKTSLLDAIRETDVVSGEAGGITQHIGAYKVRIGKQDSPAFGREIVFLDTPGHEAFTRMRARGAKVTDIVVVVVAADDGVMPQTLEAVDHAKAAGVPIIVAVNKIDKPEAQPDRVKKQLGDRGLVPEDWGGNTVFVDVSAKKRQNLDLLLEMICLVADLGNLKATPGRTAVGTVLEGKLDRGRGAVASILVQNGTLRSQDSFIVGNTFGKIRAMFDDRGRAIEEAGPSTPVEILGLERLPDAGDSFLVVSDRDKAKGIAQYRQMKEREVLLAKSSRVSLEGLAEQIKQAGVKELPLILKGDVTGSVEVLADSLQKMSTEKVRIKVIHSGVGAITESDVLLASASNAIVIGFNVKPERKAADLAEQDNVEIRLHSIIYELQDEIRKAMLGLLDPVYKENYLGRAEVLNVFRIPKIGTIAGCRVTDGILRRDAEIRLMRGEEQIYKGKLTSLKRFKDDAKEVTNGMECGVGLNTNDIQVGDRVEAFTMERVAAVLTDKEN